ncbi:MAG: GFA family protein [Actinomycetota bacterium]|nr:GFA family protein [Actinomycetota bacterium]
MTGRCLCGGVRFEIAAPPIEAYYCHCTRCQRRTGGAASAQARIDGGGFRVVAGEELVKCWRHPDGGFEKCFCRECGAHLFSRNPDDPAQMTIRMSAFEQDPGVRPAFRAFVAYAAPWEPLPDDGLERFPERHPGW